MKFTVVIPCYNSSATIERALESCIGQTYKDFEIIVVDDYSKDNSGKVASDFLTQNSNNIPHTIIELKQNCGPSCARNIGWQRATGDYIAFLDADDFWRPDKLETASSILRENPFIILLAHSHTFTNKSFEIQNIVEPAVRRISFLKILLANPASTPSTIVRRNIDLRFREDMKYTEDHELWLRVSFYHNYYYFDSKLTVLSRPLRSKGGLSSNKWEMRRGEMRMYYLAAGYSKTVFVLFPLLILFSMCKSIFKIFYSKKVKMKY